MGRTGFTKGYFLRARSKHARQIFGAWLRRISHGNTAPARGACEWWRAQSENCDQQTGANDRSCARLQSQIECEARPHLLVRPPVHPAMTKSHIEGETVADLPDRPYQDGGFFV